MAVDLEKFYALIHPNIGYRAFCTLKKFESRTVVTPYWGTSFTDLLNKYGNLLDKADIYHTCYSYNQVGRRIADNAEFFKCMVLDIDRKNGEGEATEEAILEKLRHIEQYYNAKLHINKSGGGGLHVYLPLSEILDKKTWFSASKSLLTLCSTIKGTDTRCTIDAARILRVPGTTHSKTGNLVEVLQWGECKFKPKFINGYSLEVEKKEQSYLDKRYKSVTLELVSEVCKHVERLASGWEGQPYGSWLGCGTILKRLDEGIEAFHNWSKQASNYSETKANEILETTTGNSCQSCETFAAIRMEANPCQKCKFFGRYKDALEACLSQLPKTNSEMEPSEIPLPEGYFLDEEERLCTSKSDGRSKTTGYVIASRAIYVNAIYRDGNTGSELVLFKYRSSDNKFWNQVTIPKSKIASQKGFELISDAVNIKLSKWSMFAFDAIDLYEHSEKEKKVMPLANYFGWHTYGENENKEDVFVLGHDVYGSKGVIGHAYIDTADEKLKELGVYYTSVAKSVSEEERLYQENHALLDTFLKDSSISYGSKLQVAASFMAPLFYYAVKYCPEAGLGGIFINVYGDTGGGKTLGVRMAASLWGSPGGEGIPGVLRSNISEAAVWIALDKARHLPLCMDEFLNNPIGKKVELTDDFIKAISTGRSSERATSDGKSRPVHSFNCPCLTSSNNSVIDFIGSGVSIEMAAAARARIIEYTTVNRENIIIEKAFYERCLSLYGLLGRRWLMYFMQPEVINRFKEHLSTISFGKYTTEFRFIMKFEHLLKFVVNETGLNKANVATFAPDFVAEFTRTQREAIDEATKRRLLSPAQLTILAYLNRYKHTALTYERLPNGKVPQAQREPTDAYAPGYLSKSCMYINVIEPAVVAIPQENIKSWYKETAKERSYISEMQAFIKDGSCSSSINVQILGKKDPNYLQNCLVFPQKVLQYWQALASGIIWDSPDEVEQQ